MATQGTHPLLLVRATRADTDRSGWPSCRCLMVGRESPLPRHGQHDPDRQDREERAHVDGARVGKALRIRYAGVEGCVGTPRPPRRRSGRSQGCPFRRPQSRSSSRVCMTSQTRCPARSHAFFALAKSGRRMPPRRRRTVSSPPLTTIGMLREFESRESFPDFLRFKFPEPGFGDFGDRGSVPACRVSFHGAGQSPQG